MDDINKMISRVGHLREIAKKYQGMPANKLNNVQQEVDKRNRDIERYNARLDKARDAYYDGIITKEDYESDWTRYRTNISNLQNEIKALQKSVSSVSTVMSNPWIQKLLQNGKITELDRATVVEFIDKIYVYEDKHIEIVYKFSDEFDYLFAKTF